MYNANAETLSALNVEASRTDLAIANRPRNGSLKIQQRVRILLGLWLIPSSALNAESL
jgi:hypothetical protein